MNITKNSIILFVVTLLISCSQSKSVNEELSLDEIASMVKKDSLYATVIEQAELNRKILAQDVVKKSKYNDLTYDEYYKYLKTITDSSFNQVVLELAKENEARYRERILSEHKGAIDSTLAEFKKQIDKMDPSRFFKLKFEELKKEYYRSGNVRKVMIGIRLMPLSEKLHGGSFEIQVLDNSQNKKISSGEYKFLNSSKGKTVMYLRPDYSLVRLFKNLSTEEVSKNYTFKFRAIDAQIGGKTFDPSSVRIPRIYRMCMKLDTLRWSEYKAVLQVEKRMQIKDEWYFYNEVMHKRLKEVNELAYSFKFLNKNI